MHFNTNSMATTLFWGSMSTASTSQLVEAAFVPDIENLASKSYETKARNMCLKIKDRKPLLKGSGSAWR